MPAKAQRVAQRAGFCNPRFALPLTCLCLAFPMQAQEQEKAPPAAVSSLKVTDLDGFDDHPEKIQQLLRSALALTEKNLTYTFASADPAKGGMDCSGTMYYLLRQNGFKEVPRQSNHICQWIIDKGSWQRTEDASSLTGAAFADLRPGDLLFWSGTYEHGERTPPVSHVMLYLGRHKQTGKPIVFGASDGRRYAGQRRCGVSVFDFTLPRADSKSQFYGYGSLPGLQPPPETPPLTDDPAQEENTATAAPKEEIRKAVISPAKATSS